MLNITNNSSHTNYIVKSYPSTCFKIKFHFLQSIKYHLDIRSCLPKFSDKTNKSFPHLQFFAFNNDALTNEIHLISERNVRVADLYDHKIIGFSNSIQYILTSRDFPRYKGIHFWFSVKRPPVIIYFFQVMLFKNLIILAYWNYIHLLDDL